MTFGVTPTGFVPKTVTDIEASLRARIWAKFPTMDLSSDVPWGQMVSAVASEGAEIWELGAAAYNGMDPNAAEDFQLDGTLSLRGAKRLPATYSTVVLDMGLASSKTIAPGVTANVLGDASNVWALVGPADPTTRLLIAPGPVVSTTAGTYYGFFKATTTGTNAANAGTLTVIAPAVSGWNTANNTQDAIRGSKRETDTQFRIRSDNELAAAGACTVDAMRADLLDAALVPGLIQAFVFENTTLFADPVTGLPAKSVHAVIYDGIIPAARDADIAAVVWKDKPSGISTYGATAVQITDGAGNPQNVNYDRAVPVSFWVTLSLATNSSYDPVNGPAAVKSAIATKASELLNLGVDVVALALRGCVIEELGGVKGVTDVTAFALDTHVSPTSTANILISPLQIAITDTTKITIV